MLSGTDHHTAGVGSMFGANMLTGIEGQVGYERYLHERVAPLPERLADAGYHTYMAGKWHLGLDPGRWPGDRGFERAFALLEGSGNHFVVSERQYVENNDWVEDAPENFFSTRTYTDKLIGYIDEHHGDGRPFLVYAAYTAPHWPLQAPPAFIDRYAGAYDEGYDALRTARVARARELGVIPGAEAADSFQRIGAAWDELDEEAKRHYARRMEIYAAMVENLDHHVGRLIGHLEAIGELDNTIILFLSDNGAESDEMELNPTFAARISQGGQRQLAGEPGLGGFLHQLRSRLGSGRHRALQPLQGFHQRRRNESACLRSPRGRHESRGSGRAIPQRHGHRARPCSSSPARRRRLRCTGAERCPP